MSEQQLMSSSVVILVRTLQGKPCWFGGEANKNTLPVFASKEPGNNFIRSLVERNPGKYFGYGLFETTISRIIDGHFGEEWKRILVFFPDGNGNNFDSLPRKVYELKNIPDPGHTEIVPSHKEAPGDITLIGGEERAFQRELRGARVPVVKKGMKNESGNKVVGQPKNVNGELRYSFQMQRNNLGLIKVGEDGFPCLPCFIGSTCKAKPPEPGDAVDGLIGKVNNTSQAEAVVKLFADAGCLVHHESRGFEESICLSACEIHASELNELRRLIGSSNGGEISKQRIRAALR